MSKEIYSESFYVPNVRISFPALLRPVRMKPTDTPKYQATFILDYKTHADDIKRIEAEIKKLSEERFKRVLPQNNWCLRERDRPEYEGFITIASNTTKKPAVMKADCSKVESEEDNPFYAGCYVNAMFQLGTFDAPANKGIRAQLQGVQFYAHGEPFAGGITEDEVMEQFTPVANADDQAFMQAS